MKFAGTEDEYGDSSMGMTLGMIGKGGMGSRLRIHKKKDQRAGVYCVANHFDIIYSCRYTAKRARKSVVTGSSGATGGLASSIAFTPVQGIELVNPDATKTVKEKQDG